MDFGLSEEQEQLRRVVRDFLRDRSPVALARAVMEGAYDGVETVWREMAELGWLGLTIPSELGGSGLGQLELALVLEEMGEVVCPVPFLASVAMATPAVLATGTHAQKTELLSAATLATRRMTLALVEASGAWSPAMITVDAEPCREGWKLNGEKLFVPDAGRAHSLVVSARAREGICLFVVPADAPGVSITAMTTVDATRELAVVTLSDARMPGEALLGERPQPDGTLQAIVDRIKLALAAELCGLASAALDMSVDYANIRKQFDRPIGSFQAVQHKLADMKVALENARSLVYYAAWALDTGAPDSHLAAAMAKAYASEFCPRVVADAIQAHGGIGFTWEHDLHLLFKRAKANEALFGDAVEQREIVAGCLAG